MKFIDRIKLAGELVFGGSSFDAANQSPRRARVPGASPTDFKHEFNGAARLEIIKRSRYLMKNSGLPREHRDLNVLYGVGPTGLSPIPMVDSREWIADAVEYFRQWSLRCDITERFSFAKVQKLVSRAIDTDGEIFTIRTRSRSTGEPRLQLIESHRVGNFLDPRERDEKWIDGIKVDAVGRPTHIRIRLDNGGVRDIPFAFVMHLFDAESPSAYRHPPMLAHSINHLLDEVELLALEKHAVKDNSDISRILKTTKGNLDDHGDFSANGGSSMEESDVKALQKIVGGKMVSIGTHESLESFASSRPSPTFTGFLDHLRRDSSLGSLPYEFAVDPSRSSGPGVRLTTAKAQRRFADRTQLIANDLVRPTWFYVIGNAIDKGILPPIKNWSRIKVTPPRDITVDAGRDSEANRRDVLMGLKLPTTSYEEQGGLGFLESMEEKARLIKSVEDIAKREGVDPAHLFNFSAGEKPDADSGATPPSGGDSKPKTKK